MILIEHEKTLREVVDEIMTDMFFIFPDLDDEGNSINTGSSGKDAVHIGIHFNTEHYLHFALDCDLLKEMACNFMGLEAEEVGVDEIISMGLETANIIGGNMLVRIDPSREFRLSIPEVLDSLRLQDDQSWTVTFVSEDRVLKITPLKRV